MSSKSKSRSEDKVRAVPNDPDAEPRMIKRSVDNENEELLTSEDLEELPDGCDTYDPGEGKPHDGGGVKTRKDHRGNVR